MSSTKWAYTFRDLQRLKTVIYYKNHKKLYLSSIWSLTCTLFVFCDIQIMILNYSKPLSIYNCFVELTELFLLSIYTKRCFSPDIGDIRFKKFSKTTFSHQYNENLRLLLEILSISSFDLFSHIYAILFKKKQQFLA